MPAGDTTANCFPSNSLTMVNSGGKTCTGNGAGVECIWTVTPPTCSNPPPVPAPIPAIPDTPGPTPGPDPTNSPVPPPVPAPIPAIPDTPGPTPGPADSPVPYGGPVPYGNPGDTPAPTDCDDYGVQGTAVNGELPFEITGYMEDYVEFTITPIAGVTMLSMIYQRLAKICKTILRFTYSMLVKSRFLWPQP